VLADHAPANSALALPRPTSHRHRKQPAAPLWRRSPAVPAAVVVLAVWGGADALQAGGAVSQAATNRDSLAAATPKPAGSSSAAATADAYAAADSGRVSRYSRAARVFEQPTPTTIPKRVTATAASKGKHAAIPGKTVAGTWVRPSAGQESSCFCMRWGEMHEGIDLAGPLGSPIVAAGDGVVLDAGPASGFGLWVVIQQANGDVTIYGHMYHYFVTVGQHVKAGQHIADIGANGEATGPHLHFAVRQGGPTGPYVDPVPWLKARGVSVGAYNPDA
jgi:murein DD-endopeptidase MepM/ murein hydrolase activator NlpD